MVAPRDGCAWPWSAMLAGTSRCPCTEYQTISSSPALGRTWRRCQPTRTQTQTQTQTQSRTRTRSRTQSRALHLTDFSPTIPYEYGV